MNAQPIDPAAITLPPTQSIAIVVDLSILDDEHSN